MIPSPKRFVVSAIMATALLLLTSTNRAGAFGPPKPEQVSRHLPGRRRGRRTTSTGAPTSTNLPPPAPAAAAIIQRRFAWPKDRDPRGMPPDYPRTKSRLAVTVLVTLLTWHAHNAGVCGAVLASGGCTLAASLWSPGLGQAAFAGSFAGMSSAGVLTGRMQTLLAGGLTAGLFEFLIHRKNKFLGLGGRLGLLAFVAVNAAALVSGVTPFPPGEAVSVLDWSAFVTAIRTAPLLNAAICSALGSVATIALRETAEGESSTDMSDPVRASAAVGVLAAMLVGISKIYTDLGALMAFGGSFTGMSLPSRLVKGVVPGRKYRSPPSPVQTIVCFAAAGALGGLVHAATIGLKWWSVPAGWGGKAGTCAFAGVLMFRGMEKMVYAVRKAIWGEPKEEYPELY